MSKPPTMSEKKRAFHALEGQLFPTVGQRARWREVNVKQKPRVVEVVRVSASGLTIWTRFPGPRSRLRYGEHVNRWERWEGSAPGHPFGLYRSCGERRGGLWQLYGELEF